MPLAPASSHGPLTVVQPSPGEQTCCTAPKRTSPPPVVMVLRAMSTPPGLAPVVAKLTLIAPPMAVMAESTKEVLGPAMLSVPVPRKLTLSR